MDKALRSGADALILDLEDSVVDAAKGKARAAVEDFLQRSAFGPTKAWVRINPLSSAHSIADLQMVAQSTADGVVLPKAESGDDVRRVADALGVSTSGKEPKVLPIATETPRSIFRLETYSQAAEHLAGLTWGAEDLSSAVGAVSSRTSDNGSYTALYEMARALCLVSAAAARVPAIETVYPEFRDLPGLSKFARRARHDGFVGMIAIHPTQVPVINEAFTPTEAEIKRARRIIELFETHPEAGALALEGEMLDAPHLLQARTILQRAEGRPLETTDEIARADKAY